MFGKIYEAHVLCCTAASFCGLSFILGCSGSAMNPAATEPTNPSGPVSPTVTLTYSPGTTVTTAQSLAVAVSVSNSGSIVAGTVILSSGSYASFPVTLVNGQASFTLPVSLLPPGSDSLTADFTPTSSASYSTASGSTTVSVASAATPLPVVTATPTNYVTSGSAFRALPLGNGNVLVSVTGGATNTGIEVFTPTSGGGGLQASCTLSLPPSFIADGASSFGTYLTPNGDGLALALGVDGAIFYDLPTLQTCNTTGFQVSQGPVASDEGTFDVTLTPDGKYAFVANEYGVASGAASKGNIGVVALNYAANGDVMTGSTLLGQISTGGTAIAGVTLSPDGTRLYVTSEIAGSATNVAGASNPILTNAKCTQAVGSPIEPNGILTVINVAMAEANPGPSAIISTVAAGCSPVRMVETSDQTTLWLTARGDNRVLAFSTGMLELNPDDALLGYADTGGTAPIGLRLFHNQQLMAVANSNRFTASGSGSTNATILAIPTPTTARVVQTIPTGTFPREITVGADDATLYLTDYGLPSINSGASELQVIQTTEH